MNPPPEKPNTPLCIDCQHYQLNRTWDVAVCLRRARIVDPVSANVHNLATNRRSRCQEERWFIPLFAKLLGECGSSGRFWKKKE